MFVLVPFSYNPLCMRPRRLAKGSFGPRVCLVRRGSSLSKYFLLNLSPCVSGHIKVRLHVFKRGV